VRAITAAHYEAQLSNRADTLRRLWLIWLLFTPADITGSWERIEPAVMGLTRAGQQRSAALAAVYYQWLRRLQNTPGIPPSQLAVLGEQNAQYWLRMAGPRTAGVLYAQGRRDVFQQAYVSLSGQVARQVLDGGRQTLLENVRADRHALGFARLTGPNPCAFCAMLASRGPAYKSERSARYRQDGELYHPHCACLPEPVFNSDEPWPGRASEFREMWDSFDGDRLAFRRALQST
jgi:hypothetical protein